MGEEAGVERADGMRRHLAPQQPGRRVPVDVSINLQQGVAFALVLHQERRSRPLARVHRAPHRRGPRLVEEVGSLGERQEENPGPSHCHPNPKGEGHEGVGDHRCLPHAKSGVVDEARVTPTHDGAWGGARWDGAHRGSALPL